MSGRNSGMKVQANLPNSTKIIIFGLILTKKWNERLENIDNHSPLCHTACSSFPLLPMGWNRGRTSAYHPDDDHGSAYMPQKGADHRTHCSKHHHGQHTWLFFRKCRSAIICSDLRIPIPDPFPCYNSYDRTSRMEHNAILQDIPKKH